MRKISKKQLVFTLLTLVAVGLFVWKVAFSAPDPPKTSSNANPEDVAFVTLPADAQAIRFWDDHREQMVVFETTESKYRAMFPEIQLAEISDAVWYPIRGFGDPENPPWKHSDSGTETTDGLVLDLPGEMGGVIYVYDRTSATGFYMKNGD